MWKYCLPTIFKGHNLVEVNLGGAKKKPNLFWSVMRTTYQDAL